MLRGLFASRSRTVGVLLLVLTAGTGGALLTGVVGAPGVTDVENRFGAVNDSRTVVHTDLHLHNPNPVGVRLGGTTVNYTVAMNDVALARGGTSGVALPAGNSTTSLSTTMDNERVPAWWVSHVRADETTTVSVDARARFSSVGRSVPVSRERTVETDVIGQFRSTEDRPVRSDSPLAPDPVLVVRETDAAWGEVTAERTPIDTRFVVYNPNSSPYVLTEIGYEMTMNDVEVGSGSTERAHVIEPGAEETVDTTTAIRNDRLDEWWVSHLERNQVTDVRIDFYATAELPSGETVRLPLDALTYTTTVETDVFGTKNATAAGGDGGGAAGEGDGNASTGDDGDVNGTDGDDSDDSDDDGDEGGDGGLLGAVARPGGA